MKGETIFIDGRWRTAASGETIPVVDPSTGEVFSALARGGSAEVDEAVSAARRAFESTWSGVSPIERGRILTRLSHRIARDHDRLARVEARDVGKPLAQAEADIRALARYCEFYGGAADKLHGETLPYEDGYTVMALREPMGVTAHIIPWNYPAQMFGRSVIASLAAGNAVVIKPGEDACLSLLEVAKLADEVGLPAGVMNIVTGLGEEAGDPLARHPQIDHISFTGSPQTGTLVQQAAAEHNCPTTMELGGKSPQIVFADANADALLPTLYNACVQNAGQTCSAGSRLLVQEDRFDEIVTALGERFDRTRLGSAMDNPDCGPLISARQHERVSAMVEEARSSGLSSRGRAGVGTEPLPSGGFFVKPEIFGPVDPDHTLAQQEVFGPVLVATPFRDEAEAVRMANDSDYGLVAGVWTADGGRQLRMSRALNCGQVFVNCYGAGGGVELPFGGTKRSGFGREKGMEGIRSFTRIKTVAIHHG